MKIVSRFSMVLFIMLSLYSCGSPPLEVPVRQFPTEPAMQLFSKADNLFQARDYHRALPLYLDYVAQYPDSSQVTTAMMKIAFIHRELGNHAAARAVYQRLIGVYPESLFAPDAKVGILLTFYDEGAYAQVIDAAESMLAQIDPRIYKVRIHTLVADSYLASGRASDALVRYMKALDLAEESEKPMLAAKLEEALGQLDDRAVKAGVEQLTDKQDRGSLLFAWGRLMFRQANYHAAERILTGFILDYPLHPMGDEARRLMEEVVGKTAFQRDVVGVLLPFSGPYQAFGNRALRGIELALDQFGGAMGNPRLRILIKDTASDPAQTAQAVKELAGEGVAAIIGPLATVEAAAAQAQTLGIPIITMTQKDQVPEMGSFVLRNFLMPRMQVKTLVDHAVHTLGVRRFAVLYPEEAYGRTFRDLFWEEVTAAGGRITGVESYRLEQTDFADPIKKLTGLFYPVPEDLQEGKVPLDARLDPRTGQVKDPEPVIDFEAIFIPDAAKKVGLILPQLAYHDVNQIFLLGTNLWHAPELIGMARQFAQGALVTDGYFAESSLPKVKDFRSRFSATFGAEPQFIEALAYDTASMVFQVLDGLQVPARSALLNALLSGKPFDGITGRTSFTPNGEVEKKVYLLQVRGKRFVEIKE